MGKALELLNKNITDAFVESNRRAVEIKDRRTGREFVFDDGSTISFRFNEVSITDPDIPEKERVRHL